MRRWRGGIDCRQMKRSMQVYPAAVRENGRGGWRFGRPLADEAQVVAAAEVEWRNLGERDWDEAFRSHPQKSAKPVDPGLAFLPADAQSAEWSAQEQQDAAATGDSRKDRFGGGESRIRRGVLSASLSCAPAGKRQLRFWRSCGASCRMILRPNCLKAVEQAAANH